MLDLRANAKNKGLGGPNGLLTDASGLILEHTLYWAPPCYSGSIPYYPLFPLHPSVYRALRSLYYDNLIGSFYMSQGFPGGSDGKKICLQCMWTQVWSRGKKDPLEKGMATDSSILTWEIPRTEGPGRLPYMGSQRVGHDWATNTLTYMSQIDSNIKIVIKRSYLPLFESGVLIAFCGVPPDFVLALSPQADTFLWWTGIPFCFTTFSGLLIMVFLLQQFLILSNCFFSDTGFFGWSSQVTTLVRITGWEDLEMFRKAL